MSTIIVKATKTSPLPERLVHWVAKAASDNDIRYFMTGMRVEEIEGSTSDVQLIATDGRRLHTAVVNKEYLETTIGLTVNGEDKACWKVEKLTKTSVEFGREVEDTFPNWRRVVPEGTGRTVVKTTGFVSTPSLDVEFHVAGLLHLMNAYVCPIVVNPLHMHDALSLTQDVRANVWGSTKAIRIDAAPDSELLGVLTAVIMPMQPFTDDAPLHEIFSGVYFDPEEKNHE